MALLAVLLLLAQTRCVSYLLSQRRPALSAVAPLCAGRGLLGRLASRRVASNSSSHASVGAPTHTDVKAVTLRVFGVDVALDRDPGKDSVEVHPALREALGLRMRTLSRGAVDEAMAEESTSISVVKKSFDARWKKLGQPHFTYTVDVRLSEGAAARLRIADQPGRVERVLPEYAPPAPLYPAHAPAPRVVVIGAGPAGLFCALRLSEAGLRPVVLERGQPVEIRGRDIGALINRRVLNGDSNLCYGEGGAGTWSDGKLTTRIGKNSADVRRVLSALVENGAPSRILVDGKPHLGTDRLVRILKSMRGKLQGQGCVLLFNTTVVDLCVSEESTRRVTGVRLLDGSVVEADVVVLAIGHSGRRLYERLQAHRVQLAPKGIAVGFRVEHPQEAVNAMQLGEFGLQCGRGDGKVPVADYRLVAAVSGAADRSVYSFCMCPGGQIVPTSVTEDELCVNGMSFSKRQSKWANSALVVTVSPEDMVPVAGEGALRAADWQAAMERRAAAMGGGGLVAPVQRVPDFLAGRLSEEPLPSSSYRLGVRSAPLHELYPAFVTAALREAILKFERTMPGFISEDALLHGVETRTSSPVQITRDGGSLESVSVQGLYPCGEGAGYAGGIVSAAVDGMKVGAAVATALLDRLARKVVTDKTAQSRHS